MNTLYTIGYAKLSPDRLKAQAERLNAVLVDIRFSPASRRPEWSGKRLRELLGERYVHVKALGNINYKGGPIRYVDLDGGTQAIAALLEQRPVILMCVCADVETCHRKGAAEHIADTLGVNLLHLGSDGHPSAMFNQPKLL